jgi:hypothetical protein
MACTEKLQNPQFNPSNETKKISNVAILSWQKKKKIYIYNALMELLIGSYGKHKLTYNSLHRMR